MVQQKPKPKTRRWSIYNNSTPFDDMTLEMKTDLFNHVANGGQITSFMPLDEIWHGQPIHPLLNRRVYRAIKKKGREV